MEDFDNLYTLGEKIGDGNFAEVKVCHCRKSGKKYAAKIIKMKQKTIFGHYDTDSRGMTSTEVEREVKILRSIDHENIVKLHDLHEQKECAILILELVSGGELFARVAEFDKLEEAEASCFILQILQGVEHMHSLGIVHLDLKPENIMIEDIQTKKIKIIDFGLARRLLANETIQDMAGTPEFCAPEIVNFDPITFATDMWAIGVMTYILLSGISPFAGDTQVETFQNILQCSVNFDREEFEGVPDIATDFISRLLRKNSRKRATAVECIRHPWVEQPVFKAPAVQSQFVIEKLDLNAILADSTTETESTTLLHNTASSIVQLESNVKLQNETNPTIDVLSSPIISCNIAKDIEKTNNPQSNLQPQVIQKLDLNSILVNNGVTNIIPENTSSALTPLFSPAEQEFPFFNQSAIDQQRQANLPKQILQNGSDHKKEKISTSTHRRCSVPKVLHHPITNDVSGSSFKDTEPLGNGVTNRKREIPKTSSATNSTDQTSVNKTRSEPKIEDFNKSTSNKMEPKVTVQLNGLRISEDNSTQSADIKPNSNETGFMISGRRQGTGTLLERATKWIESKNITLEGRRPSTSSTSSKFGDAFHHTRSYFGSSIAERKMVFTRDTHFNGHGFRWRLQTDNGLTANQKTASSGV